MYYMLNEETISVVLIIQESDSLNKSFVFDALICRPIKCCLNPSDKAFRPGYAANYMTLHRFPHTFTTIECRITIESVKLVDFTGNLRQL